MLGLAKRDVNRSRMHQLFCYMTLSLFSLFNIKSFDIYLLQLDVQSARKPSLFQQNYCFSKKKKTLMRYAK